jgi:hypothetical protein
VSLSLLRLHTPWESSSLKCGNVHMKKGNAGRLERARPRGKFEWEERIYIFSSVLMKDNEVAYFSYRKCTVRPSELDFRFPVPDRPKIGRKFEILMYYSGILKRSIGFLIDTNQNRDQKVKKYPYSRNFESKYVMLSEMNIYFVLPTDRPIWEGGGQQTGN